MKPEKRSFKISLGALAVLLLSGCSQDETAGTVTTVAAPLQITSARLQQSQTRTRADASKVLTTGSIGVFRSKAAGYEASQDNKQYTYSSGVWQPATGQAVYLSALDATVYAYYPYNNAYTNSAAIPLTSGEYTGTADDLTRHDPADICYAAGVTLNGSDPTAELELSHAMSMVELVFRRSNYASSLCNLTSVTISNTELISSATLDITDGTISSPVKNDVTWAPGIQVPATGNITTAALLVPCTLDAEGIRFHLTVDGKQMTAGIPAAKLPALEKGKIHRLTFAIHAASVETEEVSIIDWWREWTSGPEVEVGERDYVEVGGVKWAVENLQYHAAYHNYSFAASGAGSLLAWNALTDTDDGNATKIWDATCDPCSRLEPKGTWVTPALSDFDRLSSVPSVWLTDYGAVGRWYGASSKAEVEANPGKCLFLPMNDDLNNNGNYWCSTCDDMNPEVFYFSSTQSNGIGDAPYSSRYGIRCVRR